MLPDGSVPLIFFEKNTVGVKRIDFKLNAEE